MDVPLITITGAEIVQPINRILGALQQFGIISERLAAICNERELNEQRPARRYQLQAPFLQGAIQVLTGRMSKMTGHFIQSDNNPNSHLGA